MKKPKQKFGSLRSGGGNVLASELKGVGTAVLTVLITEIVERTVEKVFQKLTQSDATPPAAESTPAPQEASTNPLTQLRTQLEQAAPTVKSTVGLVQSAVSQFSPVVHDVLESVKQSGTAGDRLPHGDTSDYGAPDLTLPTPKAKGKQGKKKGKKKHKKD